MEINDIIDVTISVAARPISQTGFETPLFIAPHKVFSERFRIYTDSQAAVEDGFDVNGDVVKALENFFGGDFGPAQVVVGTQTFNTFEATVPTATYAAGDKFALKITAKDASSTVSDTITYTAQADDSATEVAAGLSAAITSATALAALVAPTALNGVITVAPKDGATVVFVGNGAGGTQEMEIGYTNLEDIKEAITAIAAVNNDFFFVTAHSRADADILSLAEYAEANKKIYLVSKYDADVLDPVKTDDIASQLKELQYKQTLLQIVDSVAKERQYQECAVVGSAASLNPGSFSLHGKTLPGASVSSFSSTQVNTLKNKNANYYVMIADVGFYIDGKMSDGTFFDIQHGRLWLEVRMEEDVFMLMKQKADMGSKIPYTDDGVGMVVGVMERRLQIATDVGYLAAIPRFKVKPPLVANIATVDKANRFLPDIPFEATLAGAIHRIKIRGVVTV